MSGMYDMDATFVTVAYCASELLCIFLNWQHDVHRASRFSARIRNIHSTNGTSRLKHICFAGFGRKVITTSSGGQRGSGPQRRQGGAEGRRDHNGPTAGHRGGRGRGRGGLRRNNNGPAPKEGDLDAQLDGYFGRKEEEKSGEEAAEHGASREGETKKQGEAKKKGGKKEERAAASKDDLDAQLEAYKAKTGSS